MSSETRALVPAAALVRAGEAPGPRASAEAEARLRALLAEITALDLELEQRSAALADFGRAWERDLAAAFAELSHAERLVLRLQRLEDGLLSLAARLRSGEPPPRRPRRTKRRTAARGEAARLAADRPSAWAWADPLDDGPGADVPAADEAGDAPGLAPELEAEELVLKRLYRRLARVLHPDLARDPAEQARLSELMARVNAAYAKGDRTALEVMAERVGAGEPPGELSEEDRRAHLEARLATLARIHASLARERDRLVASETERLRREAERRAAEGGDLVAETRAELAEEAAAARTDALVRLGKLEGAARELTRARRIAMKELERRGPTGARRAFDPLAESELVRRGAARLDRQRATAEARALARALEDAAGAAPWDVALTALAFFAEEAGARPPEVLATAAGWDAAWERLAPRWPGAPELARALARLPRHLVLGAREAGGEVSAGLQLAAADLLAGVRIALERPAVAAIAGEVLAALGPVQACGGCGAEAPARHLHRTRGLDTLHGLVCAGCGEVLRSYWRYGEVDGLEALAPHALRLGLVAEVTATLAGTALGFQMLPAEAEALTAERLRRRFAELYLAPYEIPLEPEGVELLAAEGPLAQRARVAGHRRLELAVAPGGELTAGALLELLRARIERRFRP